MTSAQRARMFKRAYDADPIRNCAYLVAAMAWMPYVEGLTVLQTEMNKTLRQLSGWRERTALPRWEA